MKREKRAQLDTAIFGMKFGTNVAGTEKAVAQNDERSGGPMATLVDEVMPVRGPLYLMFSRGSLTSKAIDAAIRRACSELSVMDFWSCNTPDQRAQFIERHVRKELGLASDICPCGGSVPCTKCGAGL